MYYHSGMKNISNKVVALVTVLSWVVILIISLINGFLYGSPPTATIVPPIISALIGWFSFAVTMFAVYRLYKSPDNNSFGGGQMM